MAVTRVVMGTVGACLLLTMALVPPSGAGLRGRVVLDIAEPSPVSQASMWLQRTERDLRIARIRDSLLLQARSTANVSVLVDQRVPERAARMIRERILGEWESAASATSSELIVALVSDSNRTLRNFGLYLLPETTRDPCVAIDPLNEWDIERRIRRQLPSFLRSMGAQLPGPCTFFATFGIPSEPVRAWLESVNFVWAARPAWQIAKPDRRPVEWGRPGFRQMGLLGLRACAGGALDICAALARASADSTVSGALFLSGAAYRRFDPSTGLDNAVFASQYGSYDLGPNARYLLSDLVVEFGTDRFATFWTSERPVLDAFIDAFGISQPTWFQKWAIQQFGQIRNGPGVPLPTYVFGVFLCALFVAGSTVVVRRRQIR